VLEIGRINPEISLPEARIGGTQTEISPRGINRRNPDRNLAARDQSAAPISWGRKRSTLHRRGNPNLRETWYTNYSDK
jgi:hypothetical protein